MKYLIIGLIFIMLNSCNVTVAGDDYPDISIGYYYFVPDSLKPEMRQWILYVVKAANPHSDEEPEDNIIQAEITGRRLFGEKKLGMEFYTDGKRVTIPYKELNGWQKAMCEKWKLIN